MAKPISEWTEDDVLALPPGENDTFERKGAALLDLTLSGVKQDAVLNELAKQLSAFANTGGGQIIYGVTDAGAIDRGGVARFVKGHQSTREWLEDVIPTITDFEVVGFNVYEIPPKPADSALAPDKSLYIVDVPDSERAPHQSNRDLKYYVRLGGKSHPASHRLIEDIRNRARHPKLEVQGVHIANANFTPVPGGSVSHLDLFLRWGVCNAGKVRAANACLRLSANVHLRVKSPGGAEWFERPAATSGSALLELRNPVYPDMTVPLELLTVVDAAVVLDTPEIPYLLIGNRYADDILLTFTSYADSAPARTQQFSLVDIDSERQLERVVEEEVNRNYLNRKPR